MMEAHASRVRLSPRQAEALVAAIDCLIVMLCLVGSRFLLQSGSAPDPALLASTVVGGGFALLLLLGLHHLGHYERRRPTRQQVGDILSWGLLFGSLDLGLVWLAGVDLRLPALGWATLIVLLPLSRSLARRGLDRLGLWRRPTVVVGTGENAVGAAHALLNEPSLGLPVAAFADLAAPEAARARTATIAIGDHLVPVISAARLLGPSEPAGSAPHLVIAPEAREMPGCLELFERLAAAGCDLDFVPPFKALSAGDARLARFAGGRVPAIRLRDRLSAPLSRLYKRSFDLVLGGGLFVFTAPLLGLIALVLLVVDGRPVFFGHRRVGMNGRPFACLKFRTMVLDAEARLSALLTTDPLARAEWEQERKLRHDPRISRLGAWLRRTSLDELPQLWNVVRGDMSLIGPRPVVEDELERYGPLAVFYLRTRPGLSGLWQVSGRNEIDYVERVHLDTHYVRNWTPLWDLALLLATVRVVLSRRGAY